LSLTVNTAFIVATQLIVLRLVRRLRRSVNAGRACYVRREALLIRVRWETFAAGRRSGPVGAGDSLARETPRWVRLKPRAPSSVSESQ
jgi:hypothetical protein